MKIYCGNKDWTNRLIDFGIIQLTFLVQQTTHYHSSINKSGNKYLIYSLPQNSLQGKYFIYKFFIDNKHRWWHLYSQKLQVFTYNKIFLLNHFDKLISHYRMINKSGPLTVQYLMYKIQINKIQQQNYQNSIIGDHLLSIKFENCIIKSHFQKCDVMIFYFAVDL
ncbi:unnamed protein product [Paramecium octaurelia]|uniref:Uncharacterized protein n=1 Tax=Paramecium octaurelia TaxID=43137 RepID=A0A8S1YMP4_PAROT|nr:unnamed protein product [Paramecium octaurelia]